MNRIRIRSCYASVVGVALLLALPRPLSGHQGEDHSRPQATTGTLSGASAGPRADIEEKLGEVIPPGLTFVDTEGNVCELKSKLTRPTILVLVYYGCTAECNPVLGNLASTLLEVPRKPGIDFQVVAVSIDETENPAMAGVKRDNVMRILGPAFPRDAWLFLVGDAKSIAALARAVGFHFMRQAGGIVHSTALVFIAPDGKIVRYLHGTEYLPAEVALALAEAEAGTTGVSVRKVMSYCFSYDPASRRYTADILRIAGLVITAGMVILLLFLIRPRSRKKPPTNGSGEEGRPTPPVNADDKEKRN